MLVSHLIGFYALQYKTYQTAAWSHSCAFNVLHFQLLLLLLCCLVKPFPTKKIIHTSFLASTLRILSTSNVCALSLNIDQISIMTQKKLHAISNL